MIHTWNPITKFHLPSVGLLSWCNPSGIASVSDQSSYRPLQAPRLEVGFKGQVICARGKVTVEKQRHFFLGGKTHQRPLFFSLQWCWLVSILYNVSIVLILQCVFFFRFVDASVPIFNLTVSVSPVVDKSPLYNLWVVGCQYSCCISKIAMLVYWRVESGLVTKIHGDCEIVGIEITFQDIPERFFATSRWKSPCCRKIKRHLRLTKFIIDKKLRRWTSVY